MLVAKLDHPHILKIFESGEMAVPGESGTVPFLALEFVEGGSLTKHISAGNTPHCLRT